jgi:uncharacterized protein DUF3515
VLTAVAGCSFVGGGPHPAVPSPSGAAAADCRALHGRLPDDVAGRHRVTLEEKSPYTAAWGDPAVVLRCGVPRPDVLTPGSEHYNPTAPAVEVDGVSWLVAHEDDGYRLTTTDRKAYVELWVPKEVGQPTGPPADLAKAVKATVPSRL